MKDINNQLVNAFLPWLILLFIIIGIIYIIKFIIKKKSK